MKLFKLVSVSFFTAVIATASCKTASPEHSSSLDSTGSNQSGIFKNTYAVAVVERPRTIRQSALKFLVSNAKQVKVNSLGDGAGADIRFLDGSGRPIGNGNPFIYDTVTLMRCLNCVELSGYHGIAKFMQSNPANPLSLTLTFKEESNSVEEIVVFELNQQD